MTPGAMARRRFGSAPTPSGKRLATMTKKRSAVATSLRRRIASKRSRQRSVRTTAKRSMDGEIDDSRARIDGALLMGRINHRAARGDVPRDQLLGVARRLGIERGEWLV